MSKQSDRRAHVLFEQDVAQFLEEFTKRTGFPSVSYSAHFLLRMIKSAEVSAAVDLKSNVPIPPPAPGQPPVAFRRKIRMKMKL